MNSPSVKPSCGVEYRDEPFTSAKLEDDYTNVEAFLDRMRELFALKSEQVVRGNIHACPLGRGY